MSNSKAPHAEEPPDLDSIKMSDQGQGNSVNNEAQPGCPRSKLIWISKEDTFNAPISRGVTTRPSGQKEGQTRALGQTWSESPRKGKSVRRNRMPSMDFDLAKASTNLMSSRLLRSRSWSVKGKQTGFERSHHLVSPTVDHTITAAADCPSQKKIGAEQIVESTAISESTIGSVKSSDSLNESALSYLAGEIIKAQKSSRNCGARFDRKKKSLGLLVSGAVSSRRNRGLPDCGMGLNPTHGLKDVPVSDLNQGIAQIAILASPPPASEAAFKGNRETNGAELVSKTLAKYLESRRAGSKPAPKTLASSRPGSSPPANLAGRRGAMEASNSNAQENIPCGPPREISETMAKYLESRRKGSNMGSQIVFATGTGPNPFTKLLDSSLSKPGIGRYDRFNAPRVALSPLRDRGKEDLPQLKSSKLKRSPSSDLPAENSFVPIPSNSLIAGLSPPSGNERREMTEICLRPEEREVRSFLPSISTGHGKLKCTAGLGTGPENLSGNDFYGSVDLERLDGFLNRLQYWGKFLARSPEDLFSGDSAVADDRPPTSLARRCEIERPLISQVTGHNTNAKMKCSKELTQVDPSFHSTSSSSVQRQETGGLQKALRTQNAKERLRSKNKNDLTKAQSCGHPIFNPLFSPIQENPTDVKKTPVTMIKSFSSQKRSLSLVPYVGKFCSRYGENNLLKKIVHDLSSHTHSEGRIVPYTIISSSELKNSQLKEPPQIPQVSETSEVFMEAVSVTDGTESPDLKFARSHTDDKHRQQKIIRMESGKSYVRVPSKPRPSSPSRFQGLRNLFSVEQSLENIC